MNIKREIWHRPSCAVSDFFEWLIKNVSLASSPVYYSGSLRYQVGFCEVVIEMSNNTIKMYDFAYKHDRISTSEHVTIFTKKSGICACFGVPVFSIEYICDVTLHSND